MRVTINNINKAIKKKTGLDIEIVKGDGYYWFVSIGGLNQIDYAYSQSVYVNHLTAFSVERWVSEFEDLIEGVEIPEKRTGPIRLRI